ncbi:MAG: Type 1 glutamine amidotransferase-like domain-containing protein [bacterium]
MPSIKKVLFFISAGILLAFAYPVLAHQPQLIYFQQGDVLIENPEISQAFYDELKGAPRNYLINSDEDFELYINLLVPLAENRNGRYSANVFLVGDDGEQQVAFLDGLAYEWQEFYEELGRDYYLKGPEFEQTVSAGKYRVEVFGNNNSSATNFGQENEPGSLADGQNSPKFVEDKGKYVLAVGKTETYDVKSLLSVYWQLPLLKIQFLKTSPLELFLTPFGIAGVGAIGAVLIFLAILYYLIGSVKEAIKHRQAKTLLLTSGGMRMKDEIVKLLQKPAYDITVAFVTTAAKPKENLDYLWKDWSIMKEELGFNVEEVDIEGKTEAEVMKLLKLKDIIFVEGGNAFYLLKAMRKCNFEKIIRKLLKQGKVYIGVSAGSIVAGRTIKTANKFGTGENGNIVKLKNLKGLNLVPFDIFVHYQPEHDEIIRQHIKNPKKRKKNLRILTDDQAILVQGKETMLIGKGEQVIV